MLFLINVYFIKNLNIDIKDYNCYRFKIFSLVRVGVKLGYFPSIMSALNRNVT